MGNTEKEIWGCVGIFAGFIIATTIGTFVNGWALSMLWGWFVVPTFQMPDLRIVEAIGLAMIVSFLTATRQTNTGGKGDQTSLREKIIEYSSWMIVYPVMAVGIGWIVYQFM